MRPISGAISNALNRIEHAEVPFVETEADFTVVENVLGRSVAPVRRSYDLPAADYIEFIRRTGMDMAYLAVPWRLGAQGIPRPCGRRRYVDGTMKTRARCRDLEDPGDDDIKRRLDEMFPPFRNGHRHVLQPLEHARSSQHRDRVPGLLPGGADGTEFIREFFQRVDEIVLRRLELILTYPIDAHLIYHGLSMSSGQVMSDELMEEFEFP